MNLKLKKAMVTGGIVASCLSGIGYSAMHLEDSSRTVYAKETTLGEVAEVSVFNSKSGLSYVSKVGLINAKHLYDAELEAEALQKATEEITPIIEEFNTKYENGKSDFSELKTKTENLAGLVSTEVQSLTQEVTEANTQLDTEIAEIKAEEEAEAKRKAEEEAERQARIKASQGQRTNAQVGTQTPTGAYTVDDIMFRGVINADGRVYTYYSERVLPGGGLNIPGRHIENGFVCDENGYIVVASHQPDKGAVYDTSFGKVKVYDYIGQGSRGSNHLDLYTW